MSQTIIIEADPVLDLALAKAGLGRALSVQDRKLVALYLARRAHESGVVSPQCGDERRILHTVVATGPDVDARFEALVAAYADWCEVEQDVDSWRHQTPEVPMGRDEACEYVSSALVGALAELVVELAAVSA